MKYKKYYQSEHKFNGVYSKNNLPEKKDGAFVIDLDEYKSIENHWIALYVNSDNGSTSHKAISFGSFGVGHMLKEIKNFIGNRIIITNIYRV